MKHTKSLLVAALAALSIGSASAETIYVTGSTAFRSAANTALNGLTGMTRLASDNSTYTSAGNLLFQYVNGGATNYVAVHWSGSEAGIQSICKGADGTTNAAVFGYFDPSQSFATVDSSTNGAQATNKHAGGLSFSDTYQSSSIFNGKKAGDGYNYPAAKKDNKVGIVSFVWAASKGFPTNNMTTAIAKTILGNGSCGLDFFTGSVAYQQSVVYLLGRNIDSGTRLSTLLEPGYGTATPVTQYAVGTNFTYTTNSSQGITNITASFQGTAATNSLLTFPIETINGISSKFVGNSGYSSGGTLCGFLTNSYAGQTTINVDGANPGLYTGSTYLLGYAGTSDANGKVAGGLIELSYNGVPVSTNAIAQGQYSFWGYEHCLLSPNSDTTVGAFYTNLVTAVKASTTATLSPNVALGDMQVSRAVDGGSITQNY